MVLYSITVQKKKQKNIQNWQNKAETVCYACNTEQQHENELCSRVTDSPAHRQQVWRFEYSILLSGLNSADVFLPQNIDIDSYWYSLIFRVIT